jgi:UMF1 family MFS transporter
MMARGPLPEFGRFMQDTTPRPGFLARAGLGTRETRAWAMYDWANSAYITIVVTAVFPVYYQRVAAAGLDGPTATARFGLATTAAIAIVAVMTPFLGALADLRPWKKRLLGLFMATGAGSAAGLATVGQGDWRMGLVLFALGNVGAYGSFVFYDALLPHVARDAPLDRVSTAGYALGYVGGGLLLLVALLWTAHPTAFGFADGAAAARGSFLAVGVWWALFSLPLLRRVPEPAVAGGRGPGVGPVRQLVRTLRDLLGYRDAAVFLLAFLIYNDGIVTIIRMATLYGAELNLGAGAMMGAIAMVQFLGIPFAFLFGFLGERFGTKRTLVSALAVYGAIAVTAYLMRTVRDFFLLAALVATVQGGAQALSRSLFASMIPAARSAEFFAFFAVAEKAASILGPLTFTAAVLLTGSSRVAVLWLSAFFAVGAVLLSRVDVARGRAHAVGPRPDRTAV